MPRKDDLERYEATEAQDIIRLFGAVKPPGMARPPPDFRVKVLTQVERRRARRWSLAGGIHLLSPWLAPVLAVGLLLSLSVNVWMGIQAFGQRVPGDRQAAGTLLEQGGRDIQFHTYAFQAGIQSATGLGALVAAHSVIGDQAVAFGFAAKPDSATSFLIGTLYAEALAYVRSGDQAAAAQRLATMEKTLVNGEAPNALSHYLGAMQTLLQDRRYADEVLGEFLALFEPWYAEYARSTGAQRLTLFRAGTWLENMQLAAAAGDTAALKQAEAVQYFRREMHNLHAPQGVQDALERLHHIVAQPEIPDRDVKEVLKLVKNMQQVLG